MFPAINIIVLITLYVNIEEIDSLIAQLSEINHVFSQENLIRCLVLCRSICY